MANLESLVITGNIIATTNKVSDKFKKDIYTKTAYFVTNDSNKIDLDNFGLEEYKSSEDGTKFYITQCSKEIAVYKTNNPDEIPVMLDCIAIDTKNKERETSPNFNTSGDNVKLNLIKGENQGNSFIRLQAIMSENGVNIVTAKNPFA